MGMPNKLKNFLCHKGEGQAAIFQGKVTEVTLPKLTRKLEDYRAGGMDGTVSVDLGQEKMEMTLKVGGFMAELYRDFAKPGVNAVPLRFTGAYQRDDTCAVQSVEVFCRGRLAEVDGGTSKAGDDTEQSFLYHINYYRLRVDGRDEIEIDVINMKCIVDGVDVLAEIRNAIGLDANI
ncbi:MAG: phage major tail tube protein [Pseudomonadota bacterium]|nr:phage major tail tube protein [Pseudomonadota bacterium]